LIWQQQLDGSAHFAILENHVEQLAMYNLPSADTKRRKIYHINHISWDMLSFLLRLIPLVFLQIVPD
jgi:hypothetical protein